MLAAARTEGHLTVSSGKRGSEILQPSRRNVRLYWERSKDQREPGYLEFNAVVLPAEIS